MSKSDGPANKDWMVFELTDESRFILTRLVIRNIHYAKYQGGIKNIAICGSRNDQDFEDWIVLDGIGSHMERQYFPIEFAASLAAWDRQYTFFKLLILEHYGNHEKNTFSEFALYGIKV